jgi:thioredoxin-related protein
VESLTQLIELKKVIFTFLFQKILNFENSMKLLLVIIPLIAISSFGFSQGVKWTKFEDLADSIAKQKKPIIVKIETPWCDYSKLMESKVYAKKRFVKRVGKNYYFVKLNAVSKQTINFRNKEYEFIQFSETKGLHSLAKELAEVGGVLRYPTTVVLNSDFTQNKRVVGYLNKRDFRYWLQLSEE